MCFDFEICQTFITVLISITVPGSNGQRLLLGTAYAFLTCQLPLDFLQPFKTSCFWKELFLSVFNDLLSVDSGTVLL